MKALFFTIFILTCMQANAQQHIISLNQSKQAAIAYSYVLKNGELKIGSAKADIAAARSAYLPSVSATGLGLLGFRDFVSPMPPLLDQGINNFYFVGVTGIEPIYAGGKIKTGNLLAALQLQVCQTMQKRALDSVILLTEQKYWNLVNIQEQQKTLLINEALLNSMLKVQKDMLASGLIARNDLLKVKVQLSQLLVNKSKLQNGRRVALLDLSMYTGLPFDTLMVMQDTINKKAMPAMPALQPDTSLTGNSDHQLLTRRIDGEKLQSRLANADNLPGLAIGLSASQIGSINSGIGSKFAPGSVITFTVPISNGLWGRGKQKLKQGRINEEIARNDLRDGKDKLKVGILHYWYDMKDQLVQISYAKENLEQATENLKVSQDNYKAGLVTTLDVLNAQAAYQQASNTVATAFSDLYIKTALYNYITAETEVKFK